MPEIADGLVEIANVAREPGYRSKIAVVSHADGVDPVGACVGPRGSRVRMVVSELRGEKIDIIPYNDEPARFVAKALSPARVREVLVDDEQRQATVIVPDDQLSLAIGREGQNARLAARLTGWRVDIRSETEFATEEPDAGVRRGGAPAGAAPRSCPPAAAARTPRCPARATAACRPTRRCRASRAARCYVIQGCPTSEIARLVRPGARRRRTSPTSSPRARRPTPTRPPRRRRPQEAAAAEDAAALEDGADERRRGVSGPTSRLERAPRSSPHSRRGTRPAAALRRVRTADGPGEPGRLALDGDRVVVDRPSDALGRGAYVCDAACARRPLQRRASRRAPSAAR